MVVQLY
nr:unnamed protein product [Callosobruchus analis]